AAFEESNRENLLSEIEDLKTIVAHIDDFAKMRPEGPQAVNVNELVRSVLRSFEGELGAVGRPPITPELHLEEGLPESQADPALLRRALHNLLRKSVEAMPSGGMLAITTSQSSGLVRLEISDTGKGFTQEECRHLFTPAYTPNTGQDNG